MTCRPDRRFVALVSCLLLLGGPLAAAPGEDAIAEALAALDRDDGIAAEMAGKRAMEQGAPREAVAALVGEGEFLQGDYRDAREWLGGGEFDAATHDRGFHALALLELAEDNLPAAAAAFDEILSKGPGTAQVWVDLGRLRYRAGEHHGALEAARRALELDRHEPRALEFMAQLVRDGQGLNASLPLFEEAMRAAPDDPQLLAQYAATLGETGQYTAMLAAVRELSEKHGNLPQVFYLQALLAARAGDDDLAQRLWWRTAGGFDGTPAGLLVAGVLEYRSGNPGLAVERFAQLSRMQPLNFTAELLFARALIANGEANVAVTLLEPLAERADATAYAMVLLARAYEQLGQRDLAAPWLDRAAGLTSRQPLLPAPALLLRDDHGRLSHPEDPVQQLRLLLAEGNHAEASARVGALLAQFPGSVDLQLLAGDVALLGGDPAGAMVTYRQVGEVRSNWPLVQRMTAALAQLDDPVAGRRVLSAYLLQNPRDQAAAAQLGRMQRDAGNPARATVLLRQAAVMGSGRTDALLLGDLAELEAGLGHEGEALARAEQAHGLMRSNRRVAQVLGRVLALQGGEGDPRAGALLAKARGSGLAELATR